MQGKERLVQLYEQFRTSDNFLVGLARDLLFVAGVILIIMVVSYLTLGVFGVPAVSVISESMDPHMKKGDLVIYQSPERTDIITNEDGVALDHRSFIEYGDVIIYNKYGNPRERIIHRAMYWVNEGEPMWIGGPLAPYAGYITKGDNNRAIDQATPISQGQPIKEDWVIGVSRWRIPWLGYPTMLIK